MSVTIGAVDNDLARLLEDPELAKLREFAEFSRSPRAMMRARDEKIRERYREGATGPQLALVTGLTKARIYQIVGPTRPRKHPVEPPREA
jgi:hypothetical protein